MVKKILAVLPRIFFLILVAAMAVLTLATAYIIFAPDSWPKPFYLVYQFPAPNLVEVKKPEGSSKPEAKETHEETSNPTEAPPSALLEIRPGQGLMADTGTKIVNLVDPSGRKYLRVGIVLEFAPTKLEYYTMPEEEKKEYETSFKEETDLKLPVINDTIITLLASQTFESVYTAEGKEILRTQIMDTINKKLPEYRVIYVYFTEFVVQ